MCVCVREKEEKKGRQASTHAGRQALSEGGCEGGCDDGATVALSMWGPIGEGGQRVATAGHVEREGAAAAHRHSIGDGPSPTWLAGWLVPTHVEEGASERGPHVGIAPEGGSTEGGTEGGATEREGVVQPAIRGYARAAAAAVAAVGRVGWKLGHQQRRSNVLYTAPHVAYPRSDPAMCCNTGGGGGAGGRGTRQVL